MSKWKKHDFYCGVFKEALPMVLAKIWIDANAQRIEQALPKLVPEEALQWTEGSMELAQVIQYFLYRIMPEAVSEAVEPMRSELGRQIANIVVPSWAQYPPAGQHQHMWEPSTKRDQYSDRVFGHDKAKQHGIPLVAAAWHAGVYVELQDMIAEYLKEKSPWWKANATLFRKQAHMLKTVKKIQEA